MRLGMNMLLWTTEVTLEHLPLFERLKAGGFDGVEVPISENPVSFFEELGRSTADLGLERTAILSLEAHTNPVSPDPAVRAAAVDRLKWAIERVVALGADRLGGPFHSAYAEFSGEPPTDDERKWCAETMRAAAEFAGEAGVTLNTEFLNRFECYVLTTAADARALVREVDHPSFRMLYDTHHAHIEEKDPAASIRACAEEIGHVHVSESDRGTPGTGQVAWAATMRALREIEYEGWFMIEAFSRLSPAFANAIHVWRDYSDPDEIWRDGGPFLRSAWEAAVARA